MSAAGLRSSRNRELGLLLLVAAVVAVGFTSVLVARSGNRVFATNKATANTTTLITR